MKDHLRSTSPITHTSTNALAFLITLSSAWQLHAAAPTVSNVRPSQRAGTGLVDIYYDLASSSNNLSVTVAISTNSGVAFNVGASALTGDLGSNITPGTGKHVVWNAGSDLAAQYFPNVKVRVTADDSNVAPPPGGMVLIPAGSFTMGDTLDGESDAIPVNVNVSAFYMDRYDVTYALWQQVYNWAIAHGYSFDDAGSGKAVSHPVQWVNWYDCVKWCNARSEMTGRVPAYYTDGTQTVVYRTGDLDISNNCVNWNGGYRLPTEAEWEKAARGGLSGHRFPWGDTISESQANYDSTGTNSCPYDLSNTGHNPAYNDGVFPYTSPVGSFAPNGYGLYDMAGNVWQWCWDWYGSYESASQMDPHGPAFGLDRIFRGGSWNNFALYGRTATRAIGYPSPGNDGLGFRSVVPSFSEH